MKQIKLKRGIKELNKAHKKKLSDPFLVINQGVTSRTVCTIYQIPSSYGDVLRVTLSGVFLCKTMS